MKELLLIEISKLDFNISTRHEDRTKFYHQIYNEYANFNLDITFYFSDNLEEVIDVTIDTFEAYTYGGEEVDTSDVTDDEILEALNY